MPEDHTWNDTKPGGVFERSFKEMTKVRDVNMNIKEEIQEQQNRVFTKADQTAIRQLKNLVDRTIQESNFLGPILYSDYKYIVITGGAFPSVWFGEKPKDIDIYVLNNNTSLWKTIKGHRDFNFKERPKANIHYLNNPRILSVMDDKQKKYQVMLTDFNTRQELLADFDFLHCCVSMTYLHDKRTHYDTLDPTLYITKEIHDSISNKRLIRNCTYKEPERWRIEKFKGRGWSDFTLTKPFTPSTSAGSGYTTNPCGEITLPIFTK